MLNPDLDIDRLADAYGARQRVQVHDFLEEGAAERILATMENEVDWRFALNIEGQDRVFSSADWRRLAPQERTRLLMQANENARWNFQYAFEYYQMRAAYHEGWTPATYLNDVVAFIESEAFADLGRRITGISEIKCADCQAMRYRPGHFLTQHDDTQIAARLAAYVMNFTKTWRPDWGGMLLFLDDGGNVETGYMPGFNLLNVFSVPQRHAVSYVAPSAGFPRLSITGWFLAEDETVRA